MKIKLIAGNANIFVISHDNVAILGYFDSYNCINTLIIVLDA